MLTAQRIVRRPRFGYYNPPLQQSIIALLLDNDSKPTLLSEVNMFEAKSMVHQTHTVEWTISPKTTVVLVAIKSELFKDREAIEHPNMKGMKIALAVDMRSIGKNKKWASTKDGKTYSSNNLDEEDELD